jgi:hypothetical protein
MKFLEAYRLMKSGTDIVRTATYAIEDDKPAQTYQRILRIDCTKFKMYINNLIGWRTEHISIEDLDSEDWKQCRNSL